MERARGKHKREGDAESSEPLKRSKLEDGVPMEGVENITSSSSSYSAAAAPSSHSQGSSSSYGAAAAPSSHSQGSSTEPSPLSQSCVLRPWMTSPDGTVSPDVLKKAELARCSTAPAWEYDPKSPSAVGKASFASSRGSKMFFVDHTRYLAPLGRFPLALYFRPSRFGKTFWLDVMEHYYGIRHQKTFAATFAGLDILSHPDRDESLESSFFVLRVTLPSSCDDSDYKTTFTKNINDSIRLFIEGHNGKTFELKSKEKIIIKLDENRIIDPRYFDVSMMKLEASVRLQGGQMMILVDETDRAPMNALAFGKDMHDVDAYDQACEPLRDFLSTLKQIGSAGANRFFVTGIIPLAIFGISSFNSFVDLTHHPDFADMLGLTEAEVRAALVHVKGIDNKDELDEKMRVVKEHFNGYHFFFSMEDLYNPQLMMLFSSPSSKSGFVDDFGDPAQEISDAQASYLKNRPDIARAMIQCSLNPELVLEAVIAKKVSVKTLGDPLGKDVASYLYYIGVLTLKNKRANSLTTRVCIPNSTVRHDFAQQFANIMYGTVVSAECFVIAPTSENFHAMLKAAQEKVGVMDPYRTESDFQAMVAWSLFSQSCPPMLERSPSSQNARQRQDLVVEAAKYVIVVELKIIPLRDLRGEYKWPDGNAEGQAAVKERLGELSGDTARARNEIAGFSKLYDDAVAQVREYALQHSPPAGKEMVAFAAVEVGCAYFVERVPIPTSPDGGGQSASGASASKSSRAGGASASGGEPSGRRKPNSRKNPRG